jgi:cytochrome c oxidase subunit 2
MNLSMRRTAQKTAAVMATIMATVMAATTFSTPLAAQPGQSEPWQMGFQEAVTPVMRQIAWFHDVLLLPLTIVISAFVLLLLVICVVRFNARANPTPSKTTHNTFLEVAWTVVPILILVAIAIPSFRLLYFQRDFPPADMTVKAIGSQWYWSYQYPDNGGFEFDSIMLEDDERQPNQPRLLAVDNEMVVPVGKVVRVIVTAPPTDVIHAWAVPAFGVKIDAVPGRLNETWFQADREGIYYGQCSELCGQRHAFMPIAVRVVSQADFDAWVVTAREEFAAAPVAAPDGTQVAAVRAE